MVSVLRILLVEDDLTLSRSVARTLTHQGHIVCSVAGCDAARAMRERFDCAILDLDLNDGNGADLGSELLVSRCVDFVVFFTGSAETQALERARLLGPVVRKANSFDELSRVLSERSAEARRLAYLSQRKASGVLRSPVAAANPTAILSAAGGKDNNT